MASFEEHIAQAKSNLAFLEQINYFQNNKWDWQVTVSFYVGVHLMNAHIAKIANLHYRSHEKTKEALNPFNELSHVRLDEKRYLDYVKLEGLARRSRYLCSDNKFNKETKQFLTNELQLGKAVKHLDALMSFVNTKHGTQFPIISINCKSIIDINLIYFQFKPILYTEE